MEIKKSLILIITFTIIAGIIVICTAGFNFNMMTKEHKQIQIILGDSFEENDIKEIANEVIKDKIEVQKIGEFSDQASISAKDITEEQKGEIISKINEKYGKELKAENVDVITIPGEKLGDIVSPYISTAIIAFVVYAVYLMIFIFVYRLILKEKLPTWKIIGKTILRVIIICAVIMSLIALFRIPVGESIVSIMFVVFILSVFCATGKVYKELEEKRLEKNTKKAQ